MRSEKQGSISGCGDDLFSSLEEPLVHHAGTEARMAKSEEHISAVSTCSGRRRARDSRYSVLVFPLLAALLLVTAMLCCAVVFRMASILTGEKMHMSSPSSAARHVRLRAGYTPKSKEPSEAELWPREDSPWNESAWESLRTAFHFQPPNNWMNDPNAPLFYNGWYHLFYQYNPKEAYWGLISWGHAVSKDLIHWLYVEPFAMVPDQWYDENGVWTGSATMLPLLLDGRGRGPSITAAATTSLEKEEQKRRWQQRREGDAQLIPGIMYTGSTNDSWQVQSLAFPSDPWEEDGLLVQWEKVADNPVLFPPDFINVTDFRDPTTAWWDDKRSLWTMVIGSHLRPTHTGIALLYQSADFLNWELVPHKFLHLTQGTGMWECVDFYPIPASGEPIGLDTSVSEWAGGVKHVLKASMDDTKLDFYTIGHYDTESLTFTPDEEELDLGSGFRYDWGRYYASKTFYDPFLQRRILFGWVNESDTRDDDIIKGWSGVQSIPRQVWFDNLTQNSLIQWPIEEIKSLYNRTISLTSFTLESGGIFKVEEAQGAQWDITVSFTKPILHVEQGPFMDDDSGGAVAPSFMGCNQNEILSRGALGPFGVSVLSSEDLQEQTRIYFYRLFMQENSTSNPSWKTLVCNDLSRSTMASHVDNGTYGGLVTVLQDEDELMLRILVDHSIVETFAQGGRTVITTRSYPTIALDKLANIYLFNDASTSIEVRSLTVHELSNINIHYIKLAERGKLLALLCRRKNSACAPV